MRLAIVVAALFAALSAVPVTAGGRYFAPDQESASAALAADSSGGLHAAHTGYDGETGDFIYYRHCAAACETAANWHAVSLPFKDPELIQIATTPDGRPRLLIQSSMFVAGASLLFSYGECNADCTTAANW